MIHELAPGLHAIERGWLHGNTVVAREADERLALIDTGYHSGVRELSELIEQATGRPSSALHRILLTHIHSDHAGGVAHLTSRGEARVAGHPDAIRLVEAWDPRALWLDEKGQSMPRFSIDDSIDSGDPVRFADRDWTVHWTPGHAVGGVVFHCAALGMLVSGDALWEKGFGLLNPWIDGPRVFELTEIALDTIAALDVRVMIPGHGAPVTEVAASLLDARSRLAHLRAHPDRLRMQMVRNYLGFGMLAHGAPDRERALALAEQVAKAHPPLDGDRVALDPTELARQAVAALLGS